LISYEEALKSSTSPENFAIRYSGVSHNDGQKWGENTQMGQRVEKAWQDLTAMDIEIPNNKKLKRNEPPRDEKKQASGDIPNFLKKLKR